MYANEASENRWCFSLFVYLVETEEIHAHCKRIGKDRYAQRNQNPSLAHHPEKTKSMANIRVYILPDNFLPIHTELRGFFFP